MCLAPDSRSGLDENTQGCTINTKCKRGLGYCIYAQIRNNEVTLQILNKLFHFAKPQLSLPVHNKTPLLHAQDAERESHYYGMQTLSTSNQIQCH